MPEAYREERPFEILGGKMVSMSPRPAINHNRIAGNIYRIFSLFLKGKSCEAFGDGVDLFLSEEDHFIPDGMVVCDKNKIRTNYISGAPDLVVEVLSPGTARNDRWHKKNAYEKAGVTEYWIVDGANKTVEVYLLKDGSYYLDNAYSLLPDYLLEQMTEKQAAELATEFKCHLFDGLIIRLEDIFDRVL